MIPFNSSMMLPLFILLSLISSAHTFLQPIAPPTTRPIPSLSNARHRIHFEKNVLNYQHHTSSTTRSQMVNIPEIINIPDMPFQDMGQQLFENLNFGKALTSGAGIETSIPEAETVAVLESIGRDFLIFLSATVTIVPLSAALGISPILAYLIVGALLGTNALNVFSNSKADVELGDFGILFLLFSEGLEVSTSRLKKLATYLPLGLAQISLTVGVLTLAILFSGNVPIFEYLEKFLPWDEEGLFSVTNPLEAGVLAMAGTLSTSAFVFPVLKERGWEEEDSGQAATSILLLQDLFVAPVLVLLPYIVGQGQTDYTAIGLLIAKATIGFGSVIFLGSFVLRRLFTLVAQTQSTETFVALGLLVSVGVGSIAKTLGLTDTVGAFAAGVLLANTNYRAQIQADILPFKGILLGIFFMEAGSNFDAGLMINEWPTVLAGAISLIILKATTLFLATRVPRQFEANRLSLPDAVRISLLLSGGGEFAFVVLALAEKLQLLPKDLGSLLTAIVLVTMGITPFLAELAALASNQLLQLKRDENVTLPLPSSPELPEEEEAQIAQDVIIICGYTEIGRSLMQILTEEFDSLTTAANFTLPRIAAFDTDPVLLNGNIRASISPTSIALYGDATNREVLRSSGLASSPSAIFIAYNDPARVLSATLRLRLTYPTTPIYAHAKTRSEAQTLEDSGATKVVIELDELPRSAVALLRRDSSTSAFITGDENKIK